MSPWKPDAVVLVVTLLSAPLFFYGLGDAYLWQDEAQTALLGKSVLQYGLPMVGDGPESLSAHQGTDAGLGGVYFQIAWLQAYLAAASLAVFGQTSWAARLPFAAAGWLCVPLVAWTLRRAGAGVWAARVAAILTASSVPFIVASRQARYYSLGALATLLALGTCAVLAREIARHPSGRVSQPQPDAPHHPPPSARAAGVAFAAATCLLVLSFDVTAIGVLAAIALHWLVIRGGQVELSRWDRRFWLPWSVAVALLAIWLAVSFSAPSRQAVGSLIPRFRYGPPYYLGQINAHLIPLPILLALLSLRHRARNVICDRDLAGARWSAGLLAMAVLGGVVGALLAPDRYFRYLIPVAPVMIGLSAVGLAGLSRFGRWGKGLAALLIITISSSTVPFVLSHTLLSALANASGMITVRDRDLGYKVPLAMLLRELRDPPRGPVAAAVEFLRDHAQPDDVLVTTYGELPLRFHTGLEVYGGETAQVPPPHRRPDWLWPRHLSTVYPAVRPAVEWVERELARGDYRAIELPAIDRRFENREDPELHIYSNPGPPGPPVVLYRRTVE